MMGRSQTEISLANFKDRRQFLKYLAGGVSAALSLGYLHPVEGREASLEELCSLFPQNSRCQSYLPGVQALDERKNPIQLDQLLTSTKPETPIPAKGLSRVPVVYLIAKHDGIATYAISPICTHLGCTVDWKAEQNRFVCPCHNSQYDSEGRVLKGPAKRSLPLVTVVAKQNQVRLVDYQPAIDPR